MVLDLCQQVLIAEEVALAVALHKVALSNKLATNKVVLFNKLAIKTAALGVPCSIYHWATMSMRNLMVNLKEYQSVASAGGHPAAQVRGQQATQVKGHQVTQVMGHQEAQVKGYQQAALVRMEDMDS